MILLVYLKFNLTKCNTGLTSWFCIKMEINYVVINHIYINLDQNSEESQEPEKKGLHED